MRRLVLLVGVALLSVVGLDSARAAERTDTYRYVAGPGDLTAINCDGNLKVAEEGVGGVCFDVLRGDTSVSLSVDDASGLPTSITYIFRDAASETIGEYIQFCGTSGPLTIPANAATLITYVDTALAALSPCDGAPATTGSISATFSS